VSVRVGSGEARSAEAEFGAVTPLPLAPLRLETESTLPAGSVSPSEIENHTAFFFHLTDLESGEQAHFIIPGDLSGMVGPDSSTMVLTHRAGRGYVEARLGIYVYQVSLPDVAVPPWNGGGVEFSPLLTVRAATPAEHAPEPSTLALGTLAGLGLAARRWLRRRAGAS
jgi:hypothetical protein